MSVNSLTNGAVKGAIIGTIGLLIAPQLTAGYIALKAAQFGAKSLADEHNGGSHPQSKQSHSEVGIG